MEENLNKKNRTASIEAGRIKLITAGIVNEGTHAQPHCVCVCVCAREIPVLDAFRVLYLPPSKIMVFMR
jgi:hypothetical protein